MTVLTARHETAPSQACPSRVELERAPAVRPPEVHEDDDALGAVTRGEPDAHRELGEDLLARDVLDHRLRRAGVGGGAGGAIAAAYERREQARGEGETTGR